jgi:hypothetical protein
MDLICLVLLIIDLFKPSMALSVITVVLGFIELFLLLYKQKEFSFAFICSLCAIGVGVAEICIM